MSIKVWLGGVAPEGWVQVRSPLEVIALLAKGNVSHISLEHNDDGQGSGAYTVLLWMEQVTMLESFHPPHITIHTASASVRDKMEGSISKIGRMVQARRICGY